MTQEANSQKIDEDLADYFSDEVGICDFFSECEFFAQPDVNGTIATGLKHFYCCSENRWTECRRLHHYQETGEKPPITMLPSGRIMPR